MPTDDDYGRRERLLLHQHPTSQYVHQSAAASSLPATSSASSSSSSSSTALQQQKQQQQQQLQSAAENTNSVVSAIGIVGLSVGNGTTDCYHKQQQQQQQQSNQRSASSTSSTSSVSASVGCVSAIGIGNLQERYKINERLQSSEVGSEYGVRMSHERYEKTSDKPQQQQQHYGSKSDDISVKYGQDTSLSSRAMESITGDNPVSSSRYVIGACQDQRFGQTASSSLQIANHVYSTAVTVACSRPSPIPLSCQSATSQHSQSSVLADRYSRYTEASSMSGEQRLSLQPNDRYQSIGSDDTEQPNNPYNHVRSNVGLVATSSSEERTAVAMANSTKIGATSEYANSSIISSIGGGSSGGGGGGSGNVVTIGCTANSAFSPDTFPSPPSPAPASDRFVPPPPLSPSPSEKYSSSQSLTALCYSNSPCERILPPNSPINRERCYVTAPASPMSKDSRYAAMSSERNVHVAERASSSLHEAKEHQHQQQQQRYGSSSTERLLASASPVLGALQSRDNDTSRCGIFQVPGTAIKEIGANASCVSSRYSISSDRLVSSSPIHAPVPERFTTASSKSTSGERYHASDSPNHETTLRYHHHQQQQQQQQQQQHQHHHRADPVTSLHHERYATVSSSTERYLTSSPNPEGAHGRYSSTERTLGGSGNSGNDHARESRRYSTSDRSLEGMCQKYGDRAESRGCSNSASPASTADYSCRFSAFPEATCILSQINL